MRRSCEGSGTAQSVLPIYREQKGANPLTGLGTEGKFAVPEIGLSMDIGQS